MVDCSLTLFAAHDPAAGDELGLVVGEFKEGLLGLREGGVVKHDKKISSTTSTPHTLPMVLVATMESF